MFGKIEKQRNNSIEVLRILFTFGIIIFHIFGMLDPKVQTYIYARHVRIVVEFFYIISGFFLYKSFIKTPDFKELAVKRVLRLFPPVFLVVIFIAIYKHYPFYTIIPDLTLLSSIGIAKKAVTGGYCWYVYPLFWVSCFYTGLLTIIKDRFKFNFTVALIIYFSLAMLSDYSVRFTQTAYNIFHGFNSGMLRAIIGIGLGVLFAMNLENLKNITLNKLQKTFVAFMELFLFSYLFAQLFFVKAHHVVKSSVVLIIIFSLLFICFIYQLGYFSKILNKLNLSPISKYCYCWYVAQCIPLIVLTKDSYSLVEYIILVLLITIILGILMYHFIEKPACKYARKIFKKEK